MCFQRFRVSIKYTAECVAVDKPSNILQAEMSSLRTAAVREVPLLVVVTSAVATNAIKQLSTVACHV